MLDIDNCLPLGEWAVPPLVSVNLHTCYVEMLLLSKIARTHVQWETLLKHKVNGLYIQYCATLPRCAGCNVERLIRNRAHIDSIGSHWERFMDAYRSLSGGVMHHMDTRQWKMSRRALKTLRERLDVEDGAMMTHHDAYLKRLWRLGDVPDTDALTLLDAVGEHARNAGAFFAVLQKQRRIAS